MTVEIPRLPDAPPELGILDRHVWYADRLREAEIPFDPGAETDQLAAIYHASYNGWGFKPPDSPIEIETWPQFERSATNHVPTIVADLWPEGGIGFIASPPKKGKTWLALSLALSVATGRPFLGRFAVAEPAPVLLLALEGHRAAIRGRVGCLARGLGLNPDSSDLDNLHIGYKPVGINLADVAWLAHLESSITTIDARMLIVDVLRAAANLKENDNTAFSEFVNRIRPLTRDGCGLALAHHFGKLTEITKERTPGERMSGAGAMYGAFDVGVFITGSDDGAKKLRVEFELRDLASPEPLGLELTGNQTGVNGGFIYTDTATWETREQPPDPDDLTANAAAVKPWLEQQPDRQATTAEIAYAFTCSDKTVTRRRVEYQQAGIEYVPSRGAKPSIFRLLDNPDIPGHEQLVHVDTYLDRTPGH